MKDKFIMLINSFRNFVISPVKTVSDWQNTRSLWILLGCTALFMNLIAHFIFQKLLKLDPCELCIYIRLSMFIIFIGSILTAIKPTNIILRFISGYLITGYGVIQGFLWDIKLERINIALNKINDTTFDIFELAENGLLCSTEPRFPLNIPLDKLMPSWFLPTASCGETDWNLFGFNMTEYLFIFYGIYTILFLLMIIGFFKYEITRLFNKKQK